LQNGGYLRLPVSAGAHLVRAETSLIFSTATRESRVKVNEGQRTFVALSIYKSGNTWSFNVGEADPEYALRELQKLNLSH